MPLADWMAKYSRVRALLARPDDVLEYCTDDMLDDLSDIPDSPEPAPPEECCGFCGQSLTPRERRVNRTVLVPFHAEAVATGWPFAFKPICARCFHEA
jgi:hypothetical protein